jgi:hypothetical protein
MNKNYYKFGQEFDDEISNWAYSEYRKGNQVTKDRIYQKALSLNRNESFQASPNWVR